MMNAAKLVTICALLVGSAAAAAAPAAPGALDQTHNATKNDVPLTAKQLHDYSEAVRTAISGVAETGVCPPPPIPNSGAAGAVAGDQAVVASSLSATLVVAVRALGTDSASELTSVTIEIATERKVTDATIGTALAEAAVCLYGSDPAASQLIASTLANEGTLAMVRAFQNEIAALGGDPQLASIAGQSPQVTAEEGGAPALPDAPPLAPRACANPSCT